MAELRLFCNQRRQEALGQGVACRVSPKLAEHTCEKVCGVPPAPFPFAFTLQQKGRAPGTQVG